MLTAHLDRVVPHLTVLHGTLGPLDDRLEVIAVLAVAFMLLCFIGYIGLGRKTAEVVVHDSENES